MANILSIREDEAAFKVIYQLLTPQLQECWRTLGVFANDFDLRAASFILEYSKSCFIGEMPSNMSRVENVINILIDYGLLESIPEDNRYMMNNRVRSFVLRQMDEVEAYRVYLRHAIFFLETLSRANDLTRDKRTLQAGLNLFDRAWREIRSAFLWCANSRADEVERLMLCNQFLDVGRHLLIWRLSYSQRVWLRERGLSVIERASSSSEYYLNLGRECQQQGDLQNAINYVNLSLRIIQKSGDQQGEERILGVLGTIHLALNEPGMARRRFERRLLLARNLGNPDRLALALSDLGIIFEATDPQQSMNFYQEALLNARIAIDIQLEAFIQSRLDDLNSRL